MVVILFVLTWWIINEFKNISWNKRKVNLVIELFSRMSRETHTLTAKGKRKWSG